MTGRELVEVAPGVLVATSARMSTTSTIITRGLEALLIDPAWSDEELDGLADELDRRGLRVVAGFSTHAHHDHLLWSARFGDAPRLSSAKTARLTVSERDGLLEMLGPVSTQTRDLFARVTPTTSLDFAGIRMIEHDGHAPGHTALWLPGARVLIAGDMLSDVEVPLPFYPDDLDAYGAALDRLEPYTRHARMVIPGHGAPGTDAVARLAADRALIASFRRGATPDDPRLTDPAMAADVEHLRELCRHRLDEDSQQEHR